ncbi:biofilm regulation protein phosphatase SiaA [Nitrincola alkalilacustris]|uniref:biofilm regulation protein phosphatase SiaA n=1 Tax=Nitrincola alkalilacustris TaxID=1571224 RepID=UPI00124E373E|nr:biofilm regulation protein phosphatase SiaA [Nitrincola alkalilacustris]
MANWKSGLRTKALTALLLSSLIALIPAGLIGWQVLTSVQEHFGEAYARNFTQLNTQTIIAPISRDLALSQRLAESILIRNWLLNEEDETLKAMAFEEASGYANSFSSGSYFIISNLSFQYYFNDPDQPFSDQPRYHLNPDNQDDSWFFNLIETTDHYNINVNPDVQLGTTRVWLNVIIPGEDQKLGFAGTGIDLTDFIAAFINSDEPGVTPMIINPEGAIQAHPDTSRIAFGATAGMVSSGNNLVQQLGEDESQALKAAMAQLKADATQVATLWTTLDDRRQLLAVAFIPELQWYILTAVDLNAAKVFDGPWVNELLITFGLLLIFLLMALAYAVERLLLAPLRRLQSSATEMAQGNYDVALPARSRDEIGDLNRAFSIMANKVKSHTEELEDKVRLRTFELEGANTEMQAINKLVSDSIEYASLIQRAILPDSLLNKTLTDSHFVIWLPRDGVGGDFYLFHTDSDRYLIGVVDCAGHGVPGALMTMLSRAALDQAINENGIGSPATLLTRADQILRSMLKEHDMPSALATNMDVGLVLAEPNHNRMIFAGAKMSLFLHDGQEVLQIKGGKRALLDRKTIEYENRLLAINSQTICYLCSDGYLDQAGGEQGYGMGTTQFMALLQQHADLPLPRQGELLRSELDLYRGDYSLRDDITVIGFRP